MANGLHLSLRHATDAREADGGVVTGPRRAGRAVRVVHGVGGGEVARNIWLWIHLFFFFSFSFFFFGDPPSKVVVGEAAETAGAGERPADQQNQANPDVRKIPKVVVDDLTDAGKGGREKRAEGGGGGFGRKDTDTDWTETGRCWISGQAVLGGWG